MRLVSAEDELEHAFAAASAEAEAAFGDGAIYVEKARAPARHVEIQVLCDADGGRPHARRARVLHPAAPPEAHRGVALGRARRRDARGDGVDRRTRHARRSAIGTRARSSSSSARTAPSTSSRSTAGSRSSTRSPSSSRASTSSASRCGSPQVSGSRPPAARRDAVTRSRSASTPRTRRAAFSRRPGLSRASCRPLGPGVRVDTAVASGARSRRYYDSHDREGDRVGRRPAKPRSGVPCARSRSSWSRASRRRASSRSTCSRSREFRTRRLLDVDARRSWRAALPSLASA